MWWWWLFFSPENHQFPAKPLRESQSHLLTDSQSWTESSTNPGKDKAGKGVPVWLFGYILFLKGQSSEKFFIIFPIGSFLLYSVTFSVNLELFSGTSFWEVLECLLALENRFVKDRSTLYLFSSLKNQVFIPVY